jgi:Xaa-Pro aminopeptidase
VERLRKGRLDRVASYVKQANLSGLLVNTWDNVRYITDTRAVVLIEWYVDGSYCLFNGRDLPIVMGYPSSTDLKSEFVDPSPFPFFSPLVFPDRWADSIASLAKRLGMGRGRLGLDYLPYALQARLRERLPRVEFVPIFGDLLRLRSVKNAEEVKLLREAARIVDVGITRGLRSLKAGVSERGVYARIVEATMQAGADGLPFSSILSSGKNALKHDLVTDRRLRDGDLVPLDIGAIYLGYNGDAARTGLVGAGKAPRGARELYRDHRRAFSAGVERVMPGVLASEVDETVRGTLKEIGRAVYEHPTGHGIGLRGIEMPYIGPKKDLGEDDMRLEPGMVLTLEPTSRKDRVGVVRMEDMILVTEGGHESLTKSEFLDIED